MANVNGSLLAAVQARADGHHDVGVLVIDEDATADGAGDDPESAAYAMDGATVGIQRLIRVAQIYRCLILLVQYDHSAEGLQRMGIEPMHAAGISTNPTLRSTRTRIAALLPMNTPVVTKHHPNAFKTPGLQNLLQAAHVTHLVLAGHNSNACVRATAGAGPFGPMDPGAIQGGLHVMSSQAVLHGPPANWTDGASVSFYSRL